MILLLYLTSKAGEDSLVKKLNDTTIQSMDSSIPAIGTSKAKTFKKGIIDSSSSQSSSEVENKKRKSQKGSEVNWVLITNMLILLMVGGYVIYSIFSARKRREEDKRIEEIYQTVRLISKGVEDLKRDIETFDKDLYNKLSADIKEYIERLAPQQTVIIKIDDSIRDMINNGIRLLTEDSEKKKLNERINSTERKIKSIEEELEKLKKGIDNLDHKTENIYSILQDMAKNLYQSFQKLPVKVEGYRAIDYQEIGRAANGYEVEDEERRLVKLYNELSRKKVRAVDIKKKLKGTFIDNFGNIQKNDSVFTTVIRVNLGDKSLYFPYPPYDGMNMDAYKALREKYYHIRGPETEDVKKGYFIVKKVAIEKDGHLEKGRAVVCFDEDEDSEECTT